MGELELQQISPVTIEKGEIPFDLLAMRQGKMVLICKKGFSITGEHLEKLKNRGMRFVIKKTEWNSYTQYAQKTVERIIEDKSIAPEVRAQAMHSVNKQHFGQMLADPFSEDVPQQSSDIVDNYVRYIISEPKAVQNLFALASLDVYTYSHSMNVCTLSILMAELLKPGDRAAKIEFGVAGIMHDMGKTKIDDAIITKQGKLTEEEFEQIKLHPVFSDEIIQHHGLSEEVRAAGRSHHEKIKGGGYPDNLKGNDIAWIARMLAVVDVYDALTSRRSYKKEIKNLEALKIMHGDEQSFDPKMFTTLVSLVTNSSK